MRMIIIDLALAVIVIGAFFFVLKEIPFVKELGSENCPPEFSKVKLVYQKSNDTLVYKNVSMDRKLNAFTLENGTVVLCDALKWYKTEKNSDYEEYMDKLVDDTDDYLIDVIRTLLVLLILVVAVVVFIKFTKGDFF